ncbi:hypothetical protein RRG08_029875 [Elysia crispata]|uniref:Uncharacterized protein n=1 Tax=Elysia crispata TaxID=231223 RepID=A0AAE0YJX6_9GAST|nr:hypothetical protein RRG08_029875 [Elysia crispata]
MTFRYKRYYSSAGCLHIKAARGELYARHPERIRSKVSNELATPFSASLKMRSLRAEYKSRADVDGGLADQEGVQPSDAPLSASLMHFF